MKFLTAITLIIMYTIYGIPLLLASSINPAINRVALPQEQRAYGEVVFTNSENFDVDISIIPYAYNPKTDEISEDKRYIFLKADTDTIKIQARSSYTIKYEIYPLSNQPEGTYFNILALTPLVENKDLKINMSISQLIVLDIVTTENQVKGITTTQYTTQLEVVNKGIPFITPLTIKYSIKNNSNYLLIPEGRIDIFDEKNSYEPEYVYINEEKEKVYPGETLEKEIRVSNWHISDLFVKRIALAQVYNGIDNNPQETEIEVNNYIIELGILLIVGIFSIILIKSLKEDLEKRKS